MFEKIPEGHRRCSGRCNKVLSLGDFALSNGKPLHYCRDCKNFMNLKGHYKHCPNFDEMERVYQTITACTICDSPFDESKHKKVIDHDHETDLIRGIICASCNQGLGKLGDTLEGIKSAYEYMQIHYKEGL